MFVVEPRMLHTAFSSGTQSRRLRTSCSKPSRKTRRKLYWDPVRERFRNDDEANALLSRPQRPPYVIG